QRQEGSVDPDSLELVDGPRPEAGQAYLPHAGAEAMAHHVTAAVPGVERPHHRDAAGGRRPDGEVDAVDAAMRDGVGADPVEETEMRPLGGVVVVHRAKHRPEGIGVDEAPFAAGIAGGEAEERALAEI